MALIDQRAQSQQMGEAGIIDLTADIVSAYVSHNNVSPSQLLELVSSVSAALVAQRSGSAEPESELQKPAVSIRRSVTPDAITCLSVANSSSPCEDISGQSTAWNRASIARSGA